MRRRKSKKKQMNIHFKRRCLERVGIQLDPTVLAKQIRNGQLEFYRRQSNRVTVWKLTYMGKEYLVPYDKQRHIVITVLHYLKTGEELDANKLEPEESQMVLGDL